MTETKLGGWSSSSMIWPINRCRFLSTRSILLLIVGLEPRRDATYSIAAYAAQLVASDRIALFVLMESVEHDTAFVIGRDFSDVVIEMPH